MGIQCRQAGTNPRTLLLAPLPPQLQQLQVKMHLWFLPQAQKLLNQPAPPKAAAAPAMPEGPGHTLGGGATSARRATGKAEDDPQEIRRRRLAFLDKMAKEQKEKEQGQ